MTVFEMCETYTLPWCCNNLISVKGLKTKQNKKTNKQKTPLKMAALYFNKPFQISRKAKMSV